MSIRKSLLQLKNHIPAFVKRHAALWPLAAALVPMSHAVAQESAQEKEKTTVPATVVVPAVGDAPPPSGMFPEAPKKGKAPKVRPPDPTVPGEQGSPGELNVDGVYTVKDGDTMWQLSQEFLSNPWYWPKIWSENPGVENPHWIYPGNRLKIGQSQPAQVIDESTEPLLEIKKPVEKPKDEVVLVSVPPTWMTTRRVQVASVLTSQPIAPLATVESSFEQKQMLAQHDQLYLKAAQGTTLKLGDLVSIFHPSKSVIHPKTGAMVGYSSTILGFGRIVGHEGDVFVAEIFRSSDDIQRGDLIGPAVAVDKIIKKKDNSATLDATIIDTIVLDLSNIGQHHLVYLDKGSKDGVQEGNTLTVMRKGDGLESILELQNDLSRALPAEKVAVLTVVDVRDTTCTAIVTTNTRELAVGDQAWLRPQSSGSGDAR